MRLLPFFPLSKDRMAVLVPPMSGGRRPFVPTDEHRAQVAEMSGFGVPQHNIAAIIGIDPKTLRLYFREELDVGEARANVEVGRTLFSQVMEKNTTAAIFWAKCRMGWREKQPETDEESGQDTIHITGGF